MKTTDEWMAETMQPILDRIAGVPMSAEGRLAARERMALIAAAPDLLDALQTLSAEEWRDDGDPILLDAARVKARAAITKAKGGKG